MKSSPASSQNLRGEDNFADLLRLAPKNATSREIETGGRMNLGRIPCRYSILGGREEIKTTSIELLDAHLYKYIYVKMLDNRTQT